MEASYQQIEILFAEDNPNDMVLLRDFLKYSNLLYRLHTVYDGEAALAFLHQQGVYADTPRPHFIILDIRLPKLSGWDVLTDIRATPALTTIPVVMLTGTMTEGDEECRAALQPLECFLKPMNLKGYRSLMETLAKLIRQKTSSVFLLR